MSWVERFESKILPEPNSGCWLWTGSMFAGTGYGGFKREGKFLLAHRLSYQLYIGPIPRGLQLDHLCRVRSCVNPAHLEPVSIRENVLRGVGITARNILKTHCPKGHPYSGENLMVFGGSRSCRECGRIRSREFGRAKSGHQPRLDVLSHCRSGHEWAAGNLYVDPRGGKHCRQCKRDGKRRKRAATPLVQRRKQDEEALQLVNGLRNLLNSTVAA